MQATNKSDMTQVYESTEKTTKSGIRVGIKSSFKYILKPLTIFSYHYFIEGIKAVQKDGSTRELEKITNLSYDETIKVMEKCQKDGIKVVANERKLSSKDNEFGKNKSIYQQKKATKYARRIKQLSNFKSRFPKVAKTLHIDKLIETNKEKQKKQIELHKNSRYNIFFNKSRQTYMAERIADIIEYRTRITNELFRDNTKEAIEKANDTGMKLNAQQLKDLSNKFHLHEIGEVGIDEFKKDYCIHSISFTSFLNVENELEASNIPYGVNVVKDDEDKQFANIYFENKHLERYSELGFNDAGQIYVYGSGNKNMQWHINSQDEIISFKTKIRRTRKKDL